MMVEADVVASKDGVPEAEEDSRRVESREEEVGVSVRGVLRNLFAHRRRKAVDEDDVMVCTCEKDHVHGRPGCGEDCINRLMCIECTTEYCPCGDDCSNQMFTRRQYAKISKFRCGKKGFGLQALEPIAKGQFIIEYCGEVLDENEYMRRKVEYALRGERHHYFMSLAGGEVIDARQKGNLGRFINHSCDPNCETQKWTVQGELCIGFFALKDIPAMEEITFDYNFERYGEKPTRCLCGADKCRGFIGGGGVPGEHALSEDEFEDEPEPMFLEATDEGDGIDPDKPLKGPRKASKDRNASAVTLPKPSAKVRDPVEALSSMRPAKLSEVQRRLAPLLGRNGGLCAVENVLPLLRLFKLAMSGEVVGVKSSWNIRELSLILDVTEKSSAHLVRQVLVCSGILNQLHMILTHLREDGTASAILRKVLRIFEPLPIDMRKLETVRSGHEKLSETLIKLKGHSDSVVREKASSFVARFHIDGGNVSRPEIGRSSYAAGEGFQERATTNHRSASQRWGDLQRRGDHSSSNQRVRASPSHYPSENGGNRSVDRGYGQGSPDHWNTKIRERTRSPLDHDSKRHRSDSFREREKRSSDQRRVECSPSKKQEIRLPMPVYDVYGDLSGPKSGAQIQKEGTRPGTKSGTEKGTGNGIPNPGTRVPAASRFSPNDSTHALKSTPGSNPLDATLDTWDEPDASFEKAVRAIVRRRLMKYVEVKDHPLRITPKEAASLQTKVSEYTIAKERSFWEEKKSKGKPISLSREKVERRVKEFVRARLRKQKGIM